MNARLAIDSPARSVAYDQVPFTRFHVRVAISGTGGQFSDGFSLGIIGIALSLASNQLHLNNWWLGALGAGSLIGLFLGSLFAGPLTDKIGRRPIFAWDMMIFAGLSSSQFLVGSTLQLFVLRVLLGVALGADYVVSKSLVTELAPTRTRGRLLSVLAVAWAAGYVAAYLVGYIVRDAGPQAWRWALLSSAIPSFVIFWFRRGVPESPLYLMIRGRAKEARAVVDRHLGKHVHLPDAEEPTSARAVNPLDLLGAELRRRLLVGCLFYTGQVIPFFAISTYLPSILAKLGVRDGYSAGLIFNGLLLLGALLGLLVVDRISRRLFLVGSFWLMALLLAGLVALPAGSAMTMIIFPAFAFLLAASVNLEFVYPPELFPTALRATGVGLVVACSRLGSALSTFFLPVVVASHGISVALGFCVAVLVVSAIGCQFWAPETRNATLWTP